MNILGLSFGYHDSAACILVDGRPVFFGSEERFSYRKNDSEFPALAIEAALDQTGLTASDLDAVVYYEDPVLKTDRVAKMARMFVPDPQAYLRSVMRRWLDRGIAAPLETIHQRLGVARDRIHHVEHHLSHAALAYYTSPFDRSLVVTIDGVGEHHSLQVWRGEGTRIEPLAAMSMPDSVGLLYSFFTAFCGFQINEGEYKLMGLAAFGDPSLCDEIGGWLTLNADDLRCRTDWIQWAVPSKAPFDSRFIERFGNPFDKESDSHLDARFTAVAASVQQVLEDRVEELVGSCLRRWDMTSVCLGGGVALNCNMNGRLRRGVAPALFVPPAPGDAGSAMGAALAFWHRSAERRERFAMTSPYLGTPVDPEFLDGPGRVLSPMIDVRPIGREQRSRVIADLLLQGKVIGHMHGPFEMGPRALGNRSILADPRTLEMKDRVNRLIKMREPFRPFAPAVLEGHEDTYFDLPPRAGLGRSAPENFMLATHPVRHDKRGEIAAVSHVDGTSRVQVVGPDASPAFHEILGEFHRGGGVPILLNTSLNVSGQPMASDTRSGLYTLLHSELDALVVGDNLVTRK